MNKEKAKNMKRARRRANIRSQVKGTAKRPRLSVFKSNRQIYAQLIDDDRGITIVSAYSKDVKKPPKGSITKKKAAKVAETETKAVEYVLGELLARKAKNKKISRVVFDRGGYKYHGRVKALAEGARAGGLEF
jgi:large subunit ribosomal protein L18